MNQQTIRALNALNREFYHRHAEEFSATRRSPWKGWDRLIGRVRRDLSSPVSVLDVGCGNGRFARYLADNYPQPFTYIGIDASPLALQQARETLPGRASWIQHDVVSLGPAEILPRQIRFAYSLVVAFGLLHHLPGYQTRLALLDELSRRVEPGGILAVSVWQFGRFERFRKKVVPWDQIERIDRSQLEKGDHILSWGNTPKTYRYCHFVDSAEARRLIASLPLERIDDYAADGASGNLNRYYLMSRRQPGR